MPACGKSQRTSLITFLKEWKMTQLKKPQLFPLACSPDAAACLPLFLQTFPLLQSFLCFLLPNRHTWLSRLGCLSAAPCCHSPEEANRFHQDKTPPLKACL